MRILPPLEEKIRREIRDARAKDPLVSVVALQDQLEKQFNDRTKIEERINFTRENYRLVRERLGQILWWKPEYGGTPPGYRDVNEAAKNIVMMDLAILQAEAAAGM
jgi:hypothetical protein